ncbi:cytochrome P450 monooxygenase-like protein [Macroventuria anomochaeta]|uniref:Cytochrome P450 monooxygenase-like protein n=1 Tax=Macroventuria anomochaeta TaxID=301207 RepID=A0ACB6RTP8_9PLEO|nr:cytochrome P450 monooxygenase-like protein [Macroventuria anomochaeta]KAF2625144.1 cytochrome P450 monooxygenase-like protein [Macroventuria anomochaeta]
MLFTLVFGALAATALYKGFALYRNWQSNIVLAKSSGLPVVVIPWNVFSIFWLATFYIWIPVLEVILPASWRGIWFDLLDPEWGYRKGHAPFEKIGGDVFIIASATRLTAFVADAEAVTQITTRRNDFPKPLEIYGALDIYGKNLVSTEGSDWRMHRKLTAPSFGEKNNELVFKESLHHARSLLGLWTGPDGQGNETVQDPAVATMSFALFVISSAGFDVRVKWLHEEKSRASSLENDEPKSILVGSEKSADHKMTYREAISELLHNIMWTQIIPPKYLSLSPLKVHRTVGAAVTEWGQYMDELYEVKKQQVAYGDTNNAGMDLFDAMIRGSGITEGKTNIQKSDLLGNAFVLMLAGHETTANTLHFSLIFLAMHRDSQKRLQQDIDRVFQGKPIEQWTYEEYFPKLFGGMAAAVMNETLRLLQPIVNIPKSTAPGRPQNFTMGDKTYTIPGDTHIFLNSAIHRNPKYWPAPSNTASTSTTGAQDVDTFRPERWLSNSELEDSFVDINYDDEDLRGPSGEDTSASLFKPVKGSYIPFSDGFRSCIGRRFAQVEILAVLAVIFSQYSVELAVEEWGSDEEVASMDRQRREELYAKAVQRADEVLRTKVASIITLQLRGTSVPIRLVRRGEGRFGV